MGIPLGISEMDIGQDLTRDSKTNWVEKGSKDIVARTTELYYKIKRKL